MGQFSLDAVGLKLFLRQAGQGAGLRPVDRLFLDARQNEKEFILSHDPRTVGGGEGYRTGLALAGELMGHLNGRKC
jgi:hypothetical protein